MLHSDQQGTISILTVFTLLMFTMLLMMVFNVARQHDDKVKMQNAADAAAYSGGVVLARGMNAIAFANHLEADVFAVTAFLREARDRNAESYVPQLLSAWVAAGSQFSDAEFYKFQELDQAIANKAPLEQEFVTAWSEMAALASQNMLPIFEYILGTPETIAPGARDHLIPEFQRTVVQLAPQLAQEMTLEIALRHGLRQQDLDSLNLNMLRQPNYGAGVRGPQVGVLWRTSVLPVSYSGEFDPQTRTLPVVDPEPYQPDYSGIPDADLYLDEARRRREGLAREYLRQWTTTASDPVTLGLGFADEEAKMSQFARLFLSSACGQLMLLLNDEFPQTNVPYILRDFQQWSVEPGTDPVDQAVFNGPLDRDYHFVGIAYRRHVDLNAPRMFRNPLEASADAQTFAQVSLFIPRSRYLHIDGSWVLPVLDVNGDPIPYVDNWPPEWSTFSQNWMCKLVPATTPALTSILAANPGGPVQGLRPTALSPVYNREVQAVTTH